MNILLQHGYFEWRPIKWACWLLRMGNATVKISMWNQWWFPALSTSMWLIKKLNFQVVDFLKRNAFFILAVCKMPLVLRNLCTVFTSHFLDYLPCANSQCGTLGNGMPFFFNHLKKFPGRFFFHFNCLPIIFCSLPSLPKLSR